MPYPYQYITLTPEQRKNIERELERLIRLRKWKKRKPLQALYLSNEKKTISSIAKYLDKPYSTVCRWVALFKKEGLSAFVTHYQSTS
jgi:hypothetical protein